MIGKPASQLNILDSAFSNPKKWARTENLLQMIEKLIDGSKLVAMVEKTSKSLR